ncbi:hypothetical protein BpHYR1_011513, partial [Brachionus plicatilis]
MLFPFCSKRLREVLVHQGKPDERLTDQEFNQVLEGAPMDNKGNMDYASFVHQNLFFSDHLHT